MKEIGLEQHIRIVAILYIIMGALGLLASLAFFIGGAAIGAYALWALLNEQSRAYFTS